MFVTLQQALRKVGVTVSTALLGIFTRFLAFVDRRETSTGAQFCVVMIQRWKRYSEDNGYCQQQNDGNRCMHLEIIQFE